VNSTHLYWEFVQSHKAASIDDPDYCAWMSAQVDSVTDSYAHLLEEQSISHETFEHQVQAKCEEWKWNEDNDDDTNIVAAAEAEAAVAVSPWHSSQQPLDPPAASPPSSSFSSSPSRAESRLVRDYVWIVRSAVPQGVRDYCGDK
jgi:hypothetical protein